MKDMPSAQLGTARAVVESGLDALERDRTIDRIWARDHTVWQPDPREVSNRLGWLDVAGRMATDVSRFTGLAGDARAAGLRRALLLGMGGSSLAPELFRATFGVAPGFLDLAVVDTTDPAALLGLAGAADPATTLWVVASKSGGTVETLSQMKTFHRLACEALGRDEAGTHFVAITDPGSTLARQARDAGFRATVLGDPDVGGRFSALSPFGLVPAALLGMDLDRLLGRAVDMAARCGAEVPVRENPAAVLGTALAELALAGRDKLTLVVSPALDRGFGDWVEQLVAESTGKHGKGILPVVGEPLGPPEVYGSDRVFVHLELRGDDAHEAALATLAAAGHPVIVLVVDDAYDLGGQMFLWELATAVIGARLGLNPFDQPDVEAAKVAARRVVAAFTERGALPPEEPALRDGALSVFGRVEGGTLHDALGAFLGGIAPPGYVAVQAFLEPTEATGRALRQLQVLLRDRLRVAVTVGFGPRFLHSTGQLHKGDAGHGRFLQLTADDPHDVSIPDDLGSTASTLSFGVLKAAQARGDREALAGAGRRIVDVHLGADVAAGIERLLATIRGCT
jgi:glucose-6-phosphate isomerase